MEVEVREENELRGKIGRPVWRGFRNCHTVVEMKNKLHTKKDEEETNAIFHSSRSLDCWRGIFELTDEVVKGYDGPRKIERGVYSVRKVVTEIVVFMGGRSPNAVIIAKVRRVELLLLMDISNGLSRVV
jgi:hypothetical protein